MSASAGLLSLIALLIAPGAQAQDPVWESPLFENERRLLTGWSVSVFGGVGIWDLGTLEDLVRIRADQLAADGWELTERDFGWQPSFGAEIAYHLNRRWAVRFTGEWTRLQLEDRDGRSQLILGGGQDFISVGHTTEVRTNLLIGTLALMRTMPVGPVVLGLGGGLVVAPVLVEDKVENWIDGTTSVADQRTEATGIGLGLDGTATIDFLLEGGNTIFFDAYYRNGSTRVELEDPAFDGAFTPFAREVEFSGVGIRLGMRWN